MSRIVYVNGDYLPEEAAKISVFDRGFLFADAVYEVTSVLDGKLVDFPAHLRRLHRSLGELEMPAPATDAELAAIHRELVARNALTEGMVYMQVTRGAADRDFAYPPDPRPSLVVFTQARAARGHRRGARRHPGDRGPGHPLEAPRHQDRPAPRPVDVQDDGPQGRAATTPGWSRTAS